MVRELTTAAFIAMLHRFIAWRGKPLAPWSDHGMNFVGDAYEIFGRAESQNVFSDSYSTKEIQWQFTSKHAPHFGGLWEAAVKSFKFVHALQIPICPIPLY